MIFNELLHTRRNDEPALPDMLCIIAFHFRPDWNTICRLRYLLHTEMNGNIKSLRFRFYRGCFEHMILNIYRVVVHMLERII